MLGTEFLARFPLLPALAMFLGAPQTDAFAAVHGEHMDPGLPAIMTSPMLAAQRPLAESLGTAQVPTSLISLGLFTWGGSKGCLAPRSCLSPVPTRLSLGEWISVHYHSRLHKRLMGCC